MHSVWYFLGRGEEGSAHGPQRLLRRRVCLTQLDPGTYGIPGLTAATAA